MQTILVIDDDESLRDTIGVMLEQEGFRAVLVADGRSGYEKAMLLKPDLILVDLRLPGMSGAELQDKLIAEGRRIPMIFLTAVSDEVLRARVLKWGALCVLPKPFDEEILIEYLEEAIKES